MTEHGSRTGQCWGVLTVSKENLFTMRVVRRWDKLPREVSDALCLQCLGCICTMLSVVYENFRLVLKEPGSRSPFL